MLEIEEKKMMKKINDTRKRADQIIKIKQDNEERFIMKLRYQKQVREDEERFRMYNLYQKEQAKVRKIQNVTEIHDKRHEEFKKAKYMTKLSDQIKNQINMETIKEKAKIVHEVRKQHHLQKGVLSKHWDKKVKIS